MFQCIVQPRNTWSRSSPELRELRVVYPDIRLQLNEHLRCLDSRVEAQVSLVSELQDFFRRRAEVEMDYSKSLDKLAKSLQLRHKEQKQKREQWSLFTSYSCWQQLVLQTKNLSKDHGALSELYSTHLVSRLSQVAEDVQRIYKRCREICYEIHEEILRVLHELHTTMKTYQSYQSEAKQAEAKLKVAENQRLKIEQAVPKEKLEKSKKVRLIGKEVQKRKNKYFDAKLKALKARNEYILCLEATNSTVHKYFVDDLSDLMDCMDFGFHHCVTNAMKMYTSAEESRIHSMQTGLDASNLIVSAMDSGVDKQRFLESNHTAFMIPKKFEFQGQRDEYAEPELQKLLCADMETRLEQLDQRVTTLHTESDEVWKTLATAEKTLLEMLTANDYDCSSYFGEKAIPTSKPPETITIKLRADKHETEEFYLTKLRDYLMRTSRIVRLDAKQQHINETLSTICFKRPQNGNSESTPAKQTPQRPIHKPIVRRKRIGRLQMNGQPKLFGGSLEEYLDATNQEIPLVVKSCIRIINLFGLHHQGIFRVSGSQVEINNFKEAFERGEDPLADMTDASDINSVAGVLKLYLRELREPLFPIIYFDQFMELAQLESRHQFVMKIKELVQSFSSQVVVMLRYLFAFLNHLSEFSDENMMDVYNLAICFGPTLVPVPEEKDQVQYQNLVNDLIKNIILFHEDIFPSSTEIGGLVYEKYISREPDDADVGDSPSDHAQEDIDSEVYPSEDECESLEATAQYDFAARSERELSFKKGETIALHTQVSGDWWRGCINGREGLIPDKYILLKIRDEEKEKPITELCSKSITSSDDSTRRRTSSSNDSVISESAASGYSSPPLGEVPWPPNGPNQAEKYDGNNCCSIMVTSAASSCTTSSSTSPPPPLHTHHSMNNTTAHEIIGSMDSLDSGKGSVLEDQSHTEEISELILIPAREDNINLYKKHTAVSSVVREHHQVRSKSADGTGRSRKKHAKSLSMGDDSFDHKIQLWRRRADSQGSMEYRKITKQQLTQPQQTIVKVSGGAPDLVMDLPIRKIDASITESIGSDVNSVKSCNIVSDPDSPDMGTTAERFAKQNQCTLKKYNKPLPQSSKSKPELPPKMTKPPIKAKPQIFKKPYPLPPATLKVTSNDETNFKK
ncbi:SLIT-ROBO Rho GTPase-activating protein 1-like isoform X2 [Daktulosphaira vitifoliae]|uniref:SLIT-ROBO Rho GTPase-activating protein 1-like isoform X2 n=1 Tax=Daktulosphaira vitifoliae TaxID=58002 RepID=UPI0021AAD930|nr:SLIT-ROBO Rho GTPase-activating protein 1-like isoform X2 [Daktulosphaira vitifoliae]